jgi:insertion element IS1 protein InsB
VVGRMQRNYGEIPDKLKKEGFFYSDDWDAYKGVFPSGRHKSSKIKKDTNHLERLNSTIRQRVFRLVRKTLSFSKKLENQNYYLINSSMKYESVYFQAILYNFVGWKNHLEYLKSISGSGFLFVC